MFLKMRLTKCLTVTFEKKIIFVLLNVFIGQYPSSKTAKKMRVLNAKGFYA